MLATLRSLLHRWFDRPANAQGHASPRSAKGDAEFIRPHDDISSRTIPYDEDLLERARIQWQSGDWESLTKLTRDALQCHPDRAKLALLATAGHLEANNKDAAREFIRLAQDWGCSKKLVCKILVASVHNCLGRAANIAGEHPRALQHFKNATNINSGGSELSLTINARTEMKLDLPGVKELSTSSRGTGSSPRTILSVVQQQHDGDKDQTISPERTRKSKTTSTQSVTRNIIFADHPPPDVRMKAVEATLAQYPTTFTSYELAWNFLHHIIVPPSCRWAFVSTAKNASTTVLEMLFQSEFGSSLTARYNSLVDINPRAVVHELSECNVFARAYQVGKSAKDIIDNDSLQRLCIVRNPYERAMSSFIYFCRSNETEKQWFLPDRLRINACVGFDWNKMPYTRVGFVRFLRYIQMEVARVGANHLDAHWRPQNLFIQKEIFKPSLIGRMEDLPAFFIELAKRSLLSHGSLRNIPRENAQLAGNRDLLKDPAIRHLIEDLYAMDFESFNY